MAVQDKQGDPETKGKRVQGSGMVNLIHGDCLEEMAKLEDGCVDMVCCDPPYGTTQCKWDSVIPFGPMWEQLKRLTKPNGAIVMTSSQPFTSALVMSNIEMFKYCWVWEKNAPVGFLNARRMPLKNHEDICIFYGKQPTYNPQGLKETNVKSSRKNGKTKNGGTYGEVADREYFAKQGNFPRSVQRIKRVTHKQVHPTQKPVELMEYLIKTYTNKGKTVLDFTMGSGTTGVACKRLNRNFIGIEKDEKYFHVAKQRIVQTAFPLFTDFS